MSTLWTPGGERLVGREPAPAPASPDIHPEDVNPEDLSPEEREVLAQRMAAMEEEIASTPAAVVVANHAVGLFQLAAIHMNRRPPNLEEARVAIDALAALVEGLSGRLGDDEESLQGALAQLRLAFVNLSGGTDQPG